MPPPLTPPQVLDALQAHARDGFVLEQRALRLTPEMYAQIAPYLPPFAIPDPTRSWAYRSFRRQVDRLRESRRRALTATNAHPPQGERASPPDYRDLFAQMTPGEQALASTERWREWPDSYDARVTEMAREIVAARPVCLCGSPTSLRATSPVPIPTCYACGRVWVTPGLLAEMEGPAETPAVRQDSVRYDAELDALVGVTDALRPVTVSRALLATMNAAFPAPAPTNATPGPFGFPDALAFLRRGRAVRRTTWSAGTRVVYMPPVEVSPEKVNERTQQAMGGAFAETLGVEGYLVEVDTLARPVRWVCGWTPSAADLFAEDWTAL